MTLRVYVESDTGVRVLAATLPDAAPGEPPAGLRALAAGGDQPHLVRLLGMGVATAAVHLVRIEARRPPPDT